MHTPKKPAAKKKPAPVVPARRRADWADTFLDDEARKLKARDLGPAGRSAARERELRAAGKTKEAEAERQKRARLLGKPDTSTMRAGHGSPPPKK